MRETKSSFPLRGLLITIARDRAALGREIDTLRESRIALEAQIAGKTAEIEKLREDRIRVASRTQSARTGQELLALRTRMDDLSARVGVFEVELTALNSQLVELNNKIEQISKQDRILELRSDEVRKQEEEWKMQLRRRVDDLRDEEIAETSRTLGTGRTSDQQEV